MEAYIESKWVRLLNGIKFERISAPFRLLILAVLYSGGLATSLWMAYLLRFDFSIPANHHVLMLQQMMWMLPLKLGLLTAFGQFRGLLSYFSIPDLRRLFIANGLAAVLILCSWYYFHGAPMPPRGVILADFIFSLVGLASVRLLIRMFRERYHVSHQGAAQQKRVGIVGAGFVGASLARELSSRRGLGLKPVAFFDDDESVWGSQVHGISVLGSVDELAGRAAKLRLDLLIIAMPSVGPKRLRGIVALAQQLRIPFQTVPSTDQLATGKVKVSQLRPVEIQDLLGRDPVNLETENIRQILEDKVVMVTGAGGSIGSELCRQIAGFNPKQILLIEQSEVQLFPIEQELISLGFGEIILPLIADVCDGTRIEHVFQKFHPQVVFHAAAHKHVPMMESQPGEAIKNNTIGTARLAETASKFGVQRFVMISTDKANNPTNVMGATKRLAEIFIQSLHAKMNGATKFMAVRFGNVLGSSGSVIPIFNKQIAAGGPVRVTHPEVTRFFMTIPEAVGLVLQSCAQGEGGEIFVLDMGQPIKIVDLARQLIELTGLRPDEDIEIQFVGLRPGEKLFEELSSKGENVAETHHPKIMRFVSQPRPFEAVQQFIEELAGQLDSGGPKHLKLLLKEGVPEYQPYLK